METVIDIEELDAGYGGRAVVKGVNAAIEAGETIGIIGCNGSGKSTLLKTIRGLMPARRGIIKYFGKDIREMTDKQAARTAAYLQQNVEIEFGYTGRDIVSAGRYPYFKWWQQEKEYDEHLILQCMEYTGTADLADIPVNEISGGQKQRILLARVLAQQTPLLFLDEPSTGLDMVYKEEIFRFMKSLARMGKTILIAAHELDLAARYCSRILLLGEGRIIADGQPQEVFTEELLSRAYHADVQICRNPENGNLEITAKFSETGEKKRQMLLEKICRKGR